MVFRDSFFLGSKQRTTYFFVYSFLSTIRAHPPSSHFCCFIFCLSVYYHKFWQTSRVCVALADVEREEIDRFYCIVGLAVSFVIGSSIFGKRLRGGSHFSVSFFTYYRISILSSCFCICEASDSFSSFLVPAVIPRNLGPRISLRFPFNFFVDSFCIEFYSLPSLF